MAHESILAYKDLCKSKFHIHNVSPYTHTHTPMKSRKNGYLMPEKSPNKHFLLTKE